MAQYDIDLREYWRILKKRKTVVILIALILGVFSTVFTFLRAPTPIYTSTCSIRFERQVNVEGLYANTLSWGSGDDLDTQMSVIKSYPVFEKVAAKLRLIPSRALGVQDRALRQNVIRVIENLQSKVTVSRENYTNILDIRATDEDPLFAQRLANTIALTYKDLHSQEQMKRTTEALKYIADQLRDVRQKLRESEDEFNRFIQAHQVISIDMEGENILAKTQDIQNKIEAVDEKRNALTFLLKRVRQFIKKPRDADANFYSTDANTQYQGANEKLVELISKRQSLLKDYTPKHPEVIAADRRIGEIARKMALLLMDEVTAADAKEQDLNKQLQQNKHKANVLMKTKFTFDRLKRKVDLYINMTSMLEQKNQEALIKKAEKPEEVTIVKPALTPTSPINPPKTATTGAMGIVIGLVLGLVAAFIVETFDTSLGAIEDVEQTLGSQVLGVIPHADAKELMESLEDTLPQGKNSSSVMYAAYLVSHSFPKSMIAESFRALRTNIQFKDAENETKAIAVTSASPQEGKTMVSVNLAITMAQAGMKTLLVGSDMRKPMLARAFGVEITPGLTDILLGNYAWRDTVKTITDLIMGEMSLDEVLMTPGLDNLHIITSGAIHPNPAVLIESKRMKEFLDEAGQEYDLIVFDSPPILSTADAAILGSKMDGVLLVYRVGSVSRGLLKRATTQLDQAKCNFMGVILNGMKPEISPDFQDFKYYKYYFSYGAQDTKKKKHGKHWLGLSLLSGKDRGREKETIPPLKPRKKRSADTAAGKHRPLKIFLVFVALAVLAAGLLWHNGLIDPLKLFGTETTPRGRDVTLTKAGDLAMQEKNKKETPLYKPERPFAKGIPHQVAALPAPSLQPPPEATPNRVQAQESHEGTTVRTPAAPLPYSIYLGSFRSLKRTVALIQEQAGKGLSPYWARVKFKDKGEWYRVFIGHFKDPALAEAFIHEHGLADAQIKETPYGNLVGEYPGHSKALEEQIRLLKENGFSPYTINDRGGKDGEGETRLMVGAYVTREGAEHQRGLLESHGFHGRIVTR